MKESAFFQRTEPIGELGPSAQVASSAFSLKDGQVSEAIRVPQGFVVHHRDAARKRRRLPKLDEVKERVRLDVIGDKAKELAQAKAAELVAAVKGGATMAAAAKAAGREVRTTELIARGSVITDVGVSPAVDKAAFALPVGGVSDPIPTDTGAAVVRVVEKTPVSDTDLGDRTRHAAQGARLRPPQSLLLELHDAREGKARHPHVSAGAGEGERKLDNRPRRTPLTDSDELRVTSYESRVE